MRRAAKFFLATLLKLWHGLEGLFFQPFELAVHSPAEFQKGPQGHNDAARRRLVLQ